MDLGIALIGIFCLAVCIIPFVVTSKNRKKEEKKIIVALHNLAKKNNSNINQSEICGNYAIGIDENKRILFFVLKNETKLTEQFIDLAKIKKCEQINQSRENPNKTKTIEKLYLKLISIDKNKPAIVLDFYDEEINYQFNGEIDSIYKWNQLINNLLIHK